MSYFVDFSTFTRLIVFNNDNEEKEANFDVKSTCTKNENDSEKQGNKDISESMAKKTTWLDWQFWKRNDNSSGPFSAFRKNCKNNGETSKGKEGGRKSKDVALNLGSSSGSSEGGEDLSKIFAASIASNERNFPADISDHAKDDHMVSYKIRPNGAKDVALNMKKVESLRNRETQGMLQQGMPVTSVEEKYSPQPRHRTTENKGILAQIAGSSGQKQKAEAANTKGKKTVQPTPTLQKAPKQKRQSAIPPAIKTTQHQATDSPGKAIGAVSKTLAAQRNTEKKREAEDDKKIEKKKDVKKNGETKCEPNNVMNQTIATPKLTANTRKNYVRIEEKPSIPPSPSKSNATAGVERVGPLRGIFKSPACGDPTSTNTPPSNPKHQSPGGKFLNPCVDNQNLLQAQNCSQALKRPIAFGAKKAIVESRQQNCNQQSPKSPGNTAALPCSKPPSPQAPNPPPDPHLHSLNPKQQNPNPQTPVSSPNKSSPQVKNLQVPSPSTCSPHVSSPHQGGSPQGTTTKQTISPNQHNAQTTKERLKQVLNRRRAAAGLIQSVKPPEPDTTKAPRPEPKEADSVPKRKILVARDGRAVAIEPNTPVNLPGNTAQGNRNIPKTPEKENKVRVLEKAKPKSPVKQEKPAKPIMKDACTSTTIIQTPRTSVDVAVQMPEVDENAGDEIRSLLVERPWDTERVKKMQVQLDEKIITIARMQERLRKSRAELKCTTKRCTELEEAIEASNMQGKPQLVAQVDELTDIKNELVTEVTNLTVELERERTNTKNLKTELVDIKAQLTAARKKAANALGQ